MADSSSDRTITAVTPPLATPNQLNSAHHFMSIKLTTWNYLFWRTQIVPFLRGQGLIGFVNGESPCPPRHLSSPTVAGTINPT
nr:uncharacterized protein LOC109175393 [Ipomoea batatas]